MKFYKVLKKIDEKYYSTNNICELAYKQNEWTYPEFGKLFVFESLENAKSFRSDMKHYIFECEILGEPKEGIKRAPVCFSTIETLKNYWNKKPKDIIWTEYTPRGTFFVDAVKIIGDPL